MPESSNNQMHGKAFENAIKGANGIFKLSASDQQRSPTEKFDIGAISDKKYGIPTSIKSTKNNSVALSDARSFWQSFDLVPYRMLIGVYDQEGKNKVFRSIHEIILRDKYKDALLGNITESEICDFHDTLKSFGPGLDAATRARAWAKQRKRELQPKTKLVILNPKIDSKAQRRLQCSIHLTQLIEILDEADHKLHVESFGMLVLPYSTVSGLRRVSGNP